MANKDLYAQLLQQVSTSDLVAELHRRGYKYQPKDIKKANQKDERHKETEHAFMVVIRCLLIGLIVLGFGIMFYILLSVI